MKLFPNRTRDFREEDFLRISSCPYSVKSLHPPLQPCFSADQNFANNYQKGSPKEQSCEIISKSNKLFQRRRILKNFSEVYTVKKASPIPSRQPCFSTVQNFANILEKGHTRNNPVKLFQNRTSGSRGKDF